MYHGLLADGMTPATLARVHATLSAALNTAIRRGLTGNPLIGVELPRANRPETVVWTQPQARHFLAVIRGDELEVLWRLALITGMRRGELLALRWADIDLDRGQLRVRANRIALGGNVIEGSPKTRSGRRSLYVDPQSTRLLRQAHASRGCPDGHVFTSPTGEPLSPSWVSRRFGRIVERAVLPAIRFHDLRHTSATLGLANGESLKAVSQRLGHADINVTARVYTQVPDEAAKRAALRLADVLDPTQDGQL
jgi:integrase